MTGAEWWLITAPVLWGVLFVAVGELARAWRLGQVGRGNAASIRAASSTTESGSGSMRNTTAGSTPAATGINTSVA